VIPPTTNEFLEVIRAEFDPEADIFGEGPVVEDYQEDDVGSRRSR
jgi:hypothetical protein